MESAQYVADPKILRPDQMKTFQMKVGPSAKPLHVERRCLSAFAIEGTEEHPSQQILARRKQVATRYNFLMGKPNESVSALPSQT